MQANLTVSARIFPFPLGEAGRPSIKKDVLKRQHPEAVAMGGGRGCQPALARLLAHAPGTGNALPAPQRPLGTKDL